MFFHVNQDLCIRCGLCIAICPAVFSWNDERKVLSSKNPIAEKSREEALEALESCPTEAIYQ